MKLTKIIGNNWFSVGFYSIFCFWALGLGLWFFSKKSVWAFFKCSIQAHSFAAFLGLFRNLFQPSLGLYQEPVWGLFTSLLYLGQFWALFQESVLALFWPFYTSIKHFTIYTGRSDHEQIAGNKKKYIFITCFCSTKKISYNLLQSFYYSH